VIYDPVALLDAWYQFLLWLGVGGAIAVVLASIIEGHREG
jgi:hypothetical protein